MLNPLDAATEVLNLTGLGGKLLGRLPIFIQKQGGILYHVTTYVKLGDLKIEFPSVLISVQAARKWIVTEVEGLNETVKEDMGYTGAKIAMSGEAGDFDTTLTEKLRGHFGTNAIPFLRELQRLLKSDREKNRMPLAITDKEGLLDALGIYYVVLTNLNVNPSGPKRYQFTVEMLSDVSPDSPIGPSQQEYELFPEGTGAK